MLKESQDEAAELKLQVSEKNSQIADMREARTSLGLNKRKKWYTTGGNQSLKGRRRARRNFTGRRNQIA